VSYYSFKNKQSANPRDYSESFIRTLAIQEILWRHLDKGAELELELVYPLKAKIHRWKQTDYVRFVAQVTKTTPNPQLLEGEFVYIQFPLKTWERAMYAIPLTKKKCWNSLGEDNIYFKGVKHDKTMFVIQDVERRMINEEQRAMAVKYYD
jgi:hypothetical protein